MSDNSYHCRSCDWEGNAPNRSDDLLECPECGSEPFVGPRPNSGDNRLRLVVVCATCGDELDVNLSDDSDMITYGERHECWGDRANYLAMITELGISIADERVELEVRQ